MVTPLKKYWAQIGMLVEEEQRSEHIYRPIYLAADVAQRDMGRAKLLTRMMPYLEHLDSCRYGKTDMPDGDICTCEYTSVKREAQRLLARLEEQP